MVKMFSSELFPFVGEQKNVNLLNLNSYVNYYLVLILINSRLMVSIIDSSILLQINCLHPIGVYKF